MIIHSERFYRQAVLQCPNDLSPRLAFADWLESRNDQRGRLLRVQTQLLDVNVQNRSHLESEMQELIRTGVEPIVVELSNTIGMRLALLPPGNLLMGAADNEKEAAPVEQPQRCVTISKAFLCSVFEVTHFEYEHIMGLFSKKIADPTRPAYPVTWFDAIRFCNLLSKHEKIEPYYDVNDDIIARNGPGYRLPTEAEWEYACRAGTTTRYFFGDTRKRLKEYAVYQHGWLPFYWRTKPEACGTKRSNPWGLYDMLGNVCEWCYDWFAPFERIEESCLIDPIGPTKGYARVVRGGSYLLQAAENRSAFRFLGYPADVCHGFRVVRNIGSSDFPVGRK